MSTCLRSRPVASLQWATSTIAAAGSLQGIAARTTTGPLNQSPLRRLAPAAVASATNFSTSASEPCPIYVAATRQHVGKTTTSLALMSGLQKRFGRVGFMKPVGQHWLPVQDENGETIQVDKDAVLVLDHFRLTHQDYRTANPVIIPKGYTKDFLDGIVTKDQQKEKILEAYAKVKADSEVILCEGTGHCAVGSVIQACNAEVASWLGGKMVLVANGGVGNTFDNLSLNKALCDLNNVEVAGVIVNRVRPDKMDQTREYIQKALDLHWGGDIPLLGLVPDRPFLGCPALSDLERLFGTKLLTGQKHRLKHYHVEDLNLVATSLRVFFQTLNKRKTRTIYVCHSSRNDILLGFLLDHPHYHGVATDEQPVLIVTGTHEFPLSQQVLDMIEGVNGDNDEAPPVLLAPYPTHKVMDMIHKFTPKLNSEDAFRANEAIEHYESNIDFDLLLERVGFNLDKSAASV
eukprot:Nitzschia sp. Nitz4//scaffold303_size22340//3673//5055//NITZ4_008565-RA/size22340-processed-gene-0.17-mRNA-1//-1//CDS//3329547051//3708//frame0